MGIGFLVNFSNNGLMIRGNYLIEELNGESILIQNQQLIQFQFMLLIQKWQNLFLMEFLMVFNLI